MYYGKMTDELISLRKQFFEKFGYDPNGDMLVEFGQKSYKEYVSVLKECIKTGRDLYDVMEIDLDDIF